MVVQKSMQPLCMKKVKKTSKDTVDGVLPLAGEKEALFLQFAQNLVTSKLSQKTNMITFQGRKKKMDRLILKQGAKSVNAQHKISQTQT